MRSVWLCVAAIAVGFGIWSTHFVAMLSFDIGFPATYEVGLTLASLLIAIGILGATVMPHNLYLHSSIVQTLIWFSLQ